MKEIFSVQGNRDFGYKILQWEIVKHCNMYCDYCSLHCPDKKYEICTIYKEIIDYLNQVIPKSKKPIITRLYGGECTLHPNFWEILDLFKVPFGIYTNLSQSNDFYKKCNDNELLTHYFISYHAHAVPSFEEFVDKLHILEKKNLRIAIMMEKCLLPKLENTILYLRKEFPDFPRHKVLAKVIDLFPDYYKGYNLFDYEHLLYDEQYYLLNGKKTSRFDIVTKVMTNYEHLFNRELYKCNITNYYSTLDLNGNFYYCLDTNYPICSIYEDLSKFSLLETKYILCKNRVCVPYQFEYGIKEIFNKKSRGRNGNNYSRK